MADIVTGTVTGQVDVSQLLMAQADARREAAEDTADIRREGSVERGTFARDAAVGTGAVVDAIKTAGWANSDRTGTEADRVVGQGTAYFIAGQQNDFSNATAVAALKASTDAASMRLSMEVAASARDSVAAAQLEGARTAAANALGQATLERSLLADGQRTRDLVNGINLQNLQTQMIFQNNQITAGGLAYHGLGLAYGGLNSAYQSANTSSAINAFQSQIASQGVVNTGTMAGTTQSNTPTSIR